MEIMDFQTEPVRKSASFFMISSQKSTVRRQNESPCQGSFPSGFSHRLSSASSSAFSAVSAKALGNAAACAVENDGLYARLHLKEPFQ